MNKLKNIILLLVLTLILGLTTSVYAKEVDSNSLNVLPEVINVDFKEIEYDYDSNWENINKNIISIVEEELKKNDIEIGNNKITAYVNWNSNKAEDFHNLDLSIYKTTSEPPIASRQIKIKFSNSSSKLSSEKEQMQKLLDKYENKKFYYLTLQSGKVSLNELTKHLTKEVKKILNDNNITIYASAEIGSSTGNINNIDIEAGKWDPIPFSVRVYKNDQFYAEGFLFDTVGIGIVTNDNKPILTQEIAKTDNTYIEMKKILDKKGYSNIIESYEFKLAEGTITDKISISIPCSTKYNGKKVIVLHKKSDGTYEEFITTVKDGSATIEVTELSPFMVAISNEEAATLLSNTSNNAQTSSIDIVLLSILSISSLGGIIYLVLRKKKIA